MERSSKTQITQAYLHKWFGYNEETGELYWKKIKYKSNRKIGDILGTRRGDGYLIARIEGKNYYIHRLVYLYKTGEYPENVDHRDTDRGNNRFINLRACTQRENTYNSNLYQEHSTGIKGIYFDDKTNLYQAQVYAKGKRYRKCFRDLLEATMWLMRIREEVHGDFARHT